MDVSSVASRAAEARTSLEPDVIAVDRLSLTYGGGNGGVLALSDISFTIADGEFISIVGPSGCGKSTLLKILAGLLPPSEGAASLKGTPIIGPRQDIGVVFQTPVLFPWRSVLGNVMLPADVQGLDKAQMRQRALDLIRMVGLDGFENRYPRELSGGMQQRVGIIRALIHDPAILLMDEPFGALDEQTRRLLQEELIRIWELTRTTVVFITHSMEEAVLLGDRVVLMRPRPGRIEEIIDVPLARPRSTHLDSVERSGEFVSITARLWERLRGLQTDVRHSRTAQPAPGTPPA